MSTPTAELRGITPIPNIAARVNAFDWGRISDDLDAQGCAVVEKLVTAEECDMLARLYERNDVFRSRVVMGRHGFGRGEYKYFSYPLPGIISELRTSIYPDGACCQPLERGNGN